MRSLRHYLLCARNGRREVARVFQPGARATSCNFFEMRETPIPQGVLQCQQLHRSVARGRPGRCRRRCGSSAEMRGERAIACEKNFGKCARPSASIDRIRRESRESPASDSPEASLAVTFWRRRGAAAADFFRQRTTTERRNRRREGKPALRFRRCGSAARAAARQMSSLRLRRSLTVPGLALPPEAFIT
jgi:hypothetical protein